MIHRPSSLVACLVALLAAPGLVSEAQDSGALATRTVVTILDVDGKSERVVLDSPRRFEAASWSPDGRSLILCSAGELWRIPAEGGKGPEMVPTGPSAWIDLNQGISPDGKTVAVSPGGTLATLPASGGEPRPIAGIPPRSYFKSWSPDGKSVAYAGIRGGAVDLFSAPVGGGAEVRLTSHGGRDDDADFSPDGRQVYFKSDRGGGFDIWRMPAEGAGPDDSRAERITSDGFEDASPHPSPDGKWLIFLSCRKGTSGQPSDRDVAVRRLPLPVDAARPAQAEEVVRFVGGGGSLGSRPWSPDGKRFAFIRSEPPPPTIRVVFYTPSDLAVPDGVPRQLGKVADAAERFLVEGMKRAGYPPAVERPFRRNADGALEILYFKGDRPPADGFPTREGISREVIRRVTEQAKIAGEHHVWWIFVHLGAPPIHFSDWAGGGSSRDGGSAIVNYSTLPGEIRPDRSLDEGYNDAFELKGTVHELGHALGLPHIGPDPDLGLGNSLMGPNHPFYAGRKLPNPDEVYLGAASAAILWKHPIFSGEPKGRASQPTFTLAEFRRSHDPKADRITAEGKVVGDRPHSVVVLDDRGQRDEYWARGYAARLEADGTFRVAIDRPAYANGRLRVLFCFDNGMVTGDGERVDFGNRGDILKPYRFANGRFQFAD